MTLFQRLCLALADLVLVVHAAFVAFVVVGLVLIWVGRFRSWAFVRNVWFRAAHLAAMGEVVAESLAGFVCPLTTWEDRLRWFKSSPRNYFSAACLNRDEWVTAEPREKRPFLPQVIINYGNVKNVATTWRQNWVRLAKRSTVSKHH